MKIILALLISTLVLPGLVQANEKGNGGGGVILADGKPYLLDLVEAGVEKSPYFDPDCQTDPVFLARVKKALSSIPNAPAELIARKLTETYNNVDRVLAASLVAAMEMYLWRAEDLSLIPIPDADTVVDIPAGKKIQLAARIGHSIELDLKAWKALNPGNQAALVFHEMTYALTFPLSVSDSFQSYQHQDSSLAREVTGFLFSFASKTDGHIGLMRLMNNSAMLPCDIYHQDDACGWAKSLHEGVVDLYCIEPDLSNRSPENWSLTPRWKVTCDTDPLTAQVSVQEPRVGRNLQFDVFSEFDQSTRTYLKFDLSDLHAERTLIYSGLLPLTGGETCESVAKDFENSNRSFFNQFSKTKCATDSFRSNNCP
jgi:hypothetical protein